MNRILKSIAFICIMAGLSSCMDEISVLSENNSLQCITLQLPEEWNVEVTTRTTDENSINDVLAVVIRNGVAKYERFMSPAVNGQALSLQLKSFSLKSNEKLHIFCNTGLSSINVTTEDELLQAITCKNSQSSPVMYGSATVTNVTSVTIGLTRILSKAELSISEALAGYSIESWEVCNVPSEVYVAKTDAYPSGATFTERITPGNKFAYFLPRTDNDDNAVQPKTFILLKLIGGGWYRLDFYDGASFLSINSNTHYAFTITSVLNDGYETKKEAEENTGSNIEYDIEATYNGVSNGQYLLQTNKDEILLYPIGNSGLDINALEISAIIPGSSVNNITTYTVSLVNPSGQVTLESPTDLYEGGILTTENSRRTVRLGFSGADMENSYLDIKLGNIKKRIPIRVLSSNSYLVDFGTTVGTSLFIPLGHANKDGKNRITSVDLPNVQVEVIWADQPGIQNKLELKYDGTDGKMWFEVVNKEAFTGNVVVAAKLNGTIFWSWHIWALDNSVLDYDSTLGIYDFKQANRYKLNNFIWMDRNLGALNVDKPSNRYTRGMVYQWGRKDPFPGGGDDVLSEPTIYSGTGRAYFMIGKHPEYDKVIVEPATDDKLKYSIEYPMHFMKNTTTYTMSDKTSEADWYSNSLDERKNDFWESNNEKGFYDPCPTGWRTPVLKQTGPWVGLWPSSGSADESGVTWNNTEYYPWTARRTPGGTLASESFNSTCFWWGSGSQTSLVNSTRMTPTEVTYMTASTRAMGHHVRCVKE